MTRAEFAKLIGERQPVTLVRIEDESGQVSDPVWYAISAETALRYFDRFGDRLVIDRTFPSLVRLTVIPRSGRQDRGPTTCR
ncbi:MAG: hypothetical protein F4060_02295 [Holophagales bacterium]|nr:hypothetical protein [Holophagales bacterium]MYG30070.1 hypothetical protein [Holophagales bacterium]MYI78749.1 hypothetical protein [Holophagales bacterium]